MRMASQRSMASKRVAWITARLFLADNGYLFSADPFDAIRTMEGVAGGKVGESELAAWFRPRIKPAFENPGVSR